MAALRTNVLFFSLYNQLEVFMDTVCHYSFPSIFYSLGPSHLQSQLQFNCHETHHHSHCWPSLSPIHPILKTGEVALSWDLIMWSTSQYTHTHTHDISNVFSTDFTDKNGSPDHSEITLQVNGKKRYKRLMWCPGILCAGYRTMKMCFSVFNLEDILNIDTIYTDRW